MTGPTPDDEVGGLAPLLPMGDLATKGEESITDGLECSEMGVEDLEVRDAVAVERDSAGSAFALCEEK